jgi:hypothetical protein
MKNRQSTCKYTIITFDGNNLFPNVRRDLEKDEHFIEAADIQTYRNTNF